MVAERPERLAGLITGFLAGGPGSAKKRPAACRTASAFGGDPLVVPGHPFNLAP